MSRVRLPSGCQHSDGRRTIMAGSAQRLDPVRRLHRSALWRLVTVAVLLITAAVLAWSGSGSCTG